MHSLGDSYSHQDCIAALDSRGKPWATHTTLPVDDSIPACDYHPNNMQSDDVHGREFFTYTESYSHTDAAIHAIYAELVSRSWQGEGEYPPLNLDTPLVAVTGTLTLSQTLYNFVHNWNYDQASERRNYADLIARAVQIERHHVYLPIIIK